MFFLLLKLENDNYRNGKETKTKMSLNIKNKILFFWMQVK